MEKASATGSFQLFIKPVGSTVIMAIGTHDRYQINAENCFACLEMA
jgi:hypothetical protein